MEKLRHRLGWLPLVAACALMPALAGCNSQSFALDDGIPNTPPPAVVVKASGHELSGPVVKHDTGTYPTFSPTLTVANEQIGDDDYKKTEPRMAALARARKSGSISEAEYQKRVAEYRKLASGHGDDALSAIAGKATN